MTQVEAAEVMERIRKDMGFPEPLHHVPVFTLPSSYSMHDVSEAVKLTRAWDADPVKDSIVLPVGCSLSWEQIRFGKVHYIVKQAPPEQQLHVHVSGSRSGSQAIADLLNQHVRNNRSGVWSGRDL